MRLEQPLREHCMRSKPFLTRVWPPADATAADLAAVDSRRLQALLFVGRFGPKELLPEHARHTLLRLALIPPDFGSEIERIGAQQACACALRHLIDTRPRLQPTPHAPPPPPPLYDGPGATRRISRGAPAGPRCTPLPLALLSACAVIDHLADDARAPPHRWDGAGFGHETRSRASSSGRPSLESRPSLGIDTGDEEAIELVMEQLSIATHIEG